MPTLSPSLAVPADCTSTVALLWRSATRRKVSSTRRGCSPRADGLSEYLFGALETTVVVSFAASRNDLRRFPTSLRLDPVDLYKHTPGQYRPPVASLTRSQCTSCRSPSARKRRWCYCSPRSTTAAAARRRTRTGPPGPRRPPRTSPTSDRFHGRRGKKVLSNVLSANESETMVVQLYSSVNIIYVIITGLHKRIV